MKEFDQQTLWSTMEDNPTQSPLADRMRPRTLEEFVGQEHLVGEGRLLRRAIMADKLQSSIFWGPPGSGKTSLAHIIAGMTGSEFVKLNAVTSGVADVRKVLKTAEDRRILQGKATYLLLGRMPPLVQGAERFHPPGDRIRADTLYRFHHRKPNGKHDARNRQPLPCIRLSSSIRGRYLQGAQGCASG